MQALQLRPSRPEGTWGSVTASREWPLLFKLGHQGKRHLWFLGLRQQGSSQSVTADTFFKAYSHQVPQLHKHLEVTNTEVPKLEVETLRTRHSGEKSEKLYMPFE